MSLSNKQAAASPQAGVAIAVAGARLSAPEAVDWQTAMKRAIRSTAELRRAVGLKRTLANESADSVAEPDFGTFAPLEYVALIRRGDPHDPLLRQILPVTEELTTTRGYVADPVGDLDAVAAPGVLHKYQGRALLLTTSACAVNCRYCFRREFPYRDHSAVSERWQPSIDYIQNHPDIEEVILSGGDPLTLTDKKLDGLFTALEGIAHVRRLRIHTRTPIVIPQRLTQGLIKRLAQSPLAVWLVVHANHPRELSEPVLERLEAVVDHGIPVLNQAVLLRGVNDCVDTLRDLCLKLVNHRMQPYYLHQLDRVNGTAHFEVPEVEGRALIEKLRESVPGYAVPEFVAEVAGEKSKTPLAGPLAPVQFVRPIQRSNT